MLIGGKADRTARGSSAPGAALDALSEGDIQGRSRPTRQQGGEEPRMSDFSDVSSGYQHVTKVATPGPMLNVGGAELKWYDLAPEGRVEDHIRASAQAHLASAVGQGSMSVGADAGFVLLHRCGADFYFLLTSVWRGTNELWESVRYRTVGMQDFAPFDPAYPRAGVVRPTFCVWELCVVAHEAQAWSEYLRSPRGADDREDWRQARFQGSV